MMKQIVMITIVVLAGTILLTSPRDGVTGNAAAIPNSTIENDGGLRAMKPASQGYSKEETSISVPKDARDVLIEFEHQWNAALKSHDVAWFEKNLADDFSDISSGNGALSTKAEDIANLKGDKTVYESLELSNLKARVEGNAGVVNGINQIKGHDEQGQTFDVRLSFTDTYIKRKGRWQAWASQHTRVRP